MKKILIFVIIVNFFLNGFGAIPAVTTQTIRNQTNQPLDNQLFISISFPDFQSDWVQSLPQGQEIRINDFDCLNTPGCPSLPVKNLLLALPPQATLLSVTIQMSGKVQLPGVYQLLPVPAPIPYTYNSIAHNSEEKNMEMYNSNDAYPSEPMIIRNNGSFWQYPYVSIAVCPFSYYPFSGDLFYSTRAEITLCYLQEHPADNQFPVKNNIDLLATTLFSNYNQIKQYYPPIKSSPSVISDAVEYVIITTEDFIDTVRQSNFIVWKNALGYNVKIVSTTDHDIADQHGWDLAEKIRNFLRSSYLELGIQYVLLVGDYQTVPMRYCYPDPSNHRNTAGTPGGTGGEVPTDYYYADLSSSDETSWDADGDGFYGEYKQDNPDFLPEVYVGRIPVNEPSKITYTLNKIVSFEQNTGEWKHHALAPGAFFYFSNETALNTGPMDGARIGAVIADDFMGNWTVSRYTEQEGRECSKYPGAFLTEEAWTKDWRNNQYAIVNWAAHGWSDLIARKIWSSDDGDNIPEANEMTWPTMLSLSSNLDDDYPSIVTSISCYVGYPEPNNWGNLAIDLLTLPGYGASVGIISSARTPYGSLDWPTDLGGSDSIIYEFNNNLINRSQTVGEAFYRSKFFCNLHYAWTSPEEYLDLYTFNLFGDPSLILEGKQGTIPHITITKPDTALYILNHRIIECNVPCVVGAIDIEINASDEKNGITYVQFFVNGELRGNSTIAPYTWRWTQRTFGKQILTVRAYNTTGSFASEEIIVNKFF
jgi:hypothetical protein